MMLEKVHFTEEKETMLVTLYYKAIESQKPNPILHDPAAVEAIGRIDYEFGKLKMRPDAVLATAARAKVLDGWVQEFLAVHPTATVLQLGCGLDSRIYRLQPSAKVRWFDVDFPDVIAVRRRLFPEREGYQMIGASVTETEWLAQVPNDQPVLVIAEGLLYYLIEEDVRDLLGRLLNHFANGQLIFDSVSHSYLRMQKTNAGVSATGARMRWGMRGATEFEQWFPRMTLLETLSATDPSMPNIQKMPGAIRLLVRAMNAIPAVRNIGLMLRYEWR